MRHWVISTYETGTRRDLRLVVYSSLAIMRREAVKFSKRAGAEDSEFPNAVGVCTGYEKVIVRPGKLEVQDPECCTIRLVVGYITPLIVAHEIAHAAQHIYSLDLTDDARARDHFTAGNETFAGLAGELFGAIWKTLTDADLVTDTLDE